MSVNPDNITVPAEDPEHSGASNTLRSAVPSGPDDRKHDAQEPASELEGNETLHAASANSELPVHKDSAGREGIEEEEELPEEELPEEELPEEEYKHVEPLEFIDEAAEAAEGSQSDWYILKVQVNREDSIKDALVRRVKIAGYEQFFKEIVVPTEDVAEFNKAGKRRIVKRKLYPGYIMVNMHINDDTWFLVRETPGIGDFTGSAGRPTPMSQRDVDRILKVSGDSDSGDAQIRTAIPFKHGDRVRVKEGYFQNFEGEVESLDEANGRVTVMINIFGRSTPVELEHWQIEAI